MMQPVTLAAIGKYFDETIMKDTCCACDHHSMFAAVLENEGLLLTELQRLKKAQLERMTGWGRNHGKKDQLIRSVWHSLLVQFTLKDTFTQGFSEKFEDVVKRDVAQVTDQSMVAWRQERLANREARVREAEERERATNSPQTLKDFEVCIRRRGMKYLLDHAVKVPAGRGKTYEIEQMVRAAGMRQLTEDELALFDELMAAKAQEKRADKMVEKATVRRIEIGDGNYMEVMKWWHSKRECDTWLVVLAEREDRTTFEELCIAARKLGGNYSRAWEERPGGFQFFDEGQAEKFVMLQSKDVFDMARLERLVAHRERVRDNAIGHFTTLSDRMEDRAQGVLLDPTIQPRTERQTMHAENARDRANDQMAMAGTLRAYARDLQLRLTRHTDRIRWRTHAEALDEILARARRELPQVEYPWPAVHKMALFQIAEQIRDQDGSKLISQRILKMAMEAKSDLVHFHSDQAADTLRHFYRRARLHRVKGWMLDSVRHALGNFKRLRLMNLDSLPELRAALREHLGRRVENQELTRADKVMMDLYPGKFPPDYFPTPRDVVELMLEYADIEPGMRVLEPSAGSGHIANVVSRALDQGPGLGGFTTVEISGMLCRALEAQGWQPLQRDFLQQHVADLGGPFDRVIMNPPFGCDGRGTDIDHVRHAYTMLNDTGRLVSVMSDGVFYRGDEKAKEFRAWMDHVGGFDFELPEGAFLNSDRPTSWATRVVVINKGGPDVVLDQELRSGGDQ